MAPTSKNAMAADIVSAVPAPADVELTPIPPAPVLDNKRDEDPYLIEFIQPIDPSNPKDWPHSRKIAVTDVLAATGFCRIMVRYCKVSRHKDFMIMDKISARSSRPPLPTIKTELHMNSTEAAMALSIYLLATAFGPLIIGPLSEIYGRKNILHACNAWFLVWNLVCGFANTKGLLIAARFLAGFGASSIYALAGGVLGDVWRAEERGRSLRLYLLIQLLGAAVGPIIGGFMAARATWRWMFWSTSSFQALMLIAELTVFHETYAPVILRKRAERLRRSTGNKEYRTVHEHLEDKKSVTTVLARALTRPLRLLAFHPIIQVTALIQAWSYGILYIVLSSFASLWTSQYAQPTELSGLHYIACAAGEIAGSQVGGPMMDLLYRRMRARSPDGNHRPEFRVLMTFPGALLVSLGLLLYGWAAHFRVHWGVVDAAVFLYMFGGQIAGMGMQAYVMDVYAEHTSSALAASQFLRSLTAFLFPLFAPAMYGAMGYGWGNTMLALGGFVIGLPSPGIIWVFGERLRRRASDSY
ncbi:putative efflux pump antibiotic resistance protein [Mycena venus]|uniref:Putative efflux pump antibiotic resistance protein n=1 Tax=Mycena venus TaxID=2733690 RepID=A0A8H6YNV2_9AGAR|nr:putative efflux pump antibiotic resistance protein [Mycena venus]